MMTAIHCIVPMLPLLAGFPAAASVEPPAPSRDAAPLAHTYSIVARDPQTGEMGVAVQSHWFSVGSVVPWAEPGVGAVATQSFVEISYGPKGLELMRSGKSPSDALKELLAQDLQRDVRQVAMIDAQGRVAAWTGPKCIAAAGDTQGEQFSVQANLMENDRVWPAMKKAFLGARGDLADRMLAALDAAEAEGGDIRGRQSAAILIVKGERTDKPWTGRVMDLRVEDHAKPLEELRRLMTVHRAYRHADQGDTFAAQGKIGEAMSSYRQASELLPDSAELVFWKAVGLWNSGRKDEALAIFRDVFARDRRWVRLTPRLIPAGQLNATAEELDRILGQAGSRK
jgi:uncharacterized Ntn-hydrolase superfamily protein